MRYIVEAMAVTLALLTSAPAALGGAAYECVRTAGCEVRYWDEENGEWAPPQAVPRGTIVELVAPVEVVPWGDGWTPLD